MLGSAARLAERTNRDGYAISACFRSYSKSGAIADMLIPTLCADIVAKVGNCLAIISLLKVDTSDDRRSL
jgi:hypothetical protein